MASAKTRLAVALAAAVLGSGAPRAQDAFDNPKTGTAPCVVISRYSAEEGDRADGRHRASAALRNICGRSVEVQFCFLYFAPVDGADRSCFGGTLRPWNNAAIPPLRAGQMITGFEHRWRFLP